MRLHAGILRPADRYRNAIRALSPAAWFRADTGVTGTLTASAWADQSGNGRNLEQGTAGNQPIHLSYSGTPYAWLPAVASNTFTSPNKSVTGSKTFTLDVALDDYTPAADVTIVDKTSGNDGFAVKWLTTDKIRLVVGDGASLTNVDSDATGITNAARKTITITWADGVGATFAIDGVTLGSQVAAAKTLTNAAVAVTVGSSTSAGKVYSFGVNGVYGLNPSDFAETSTNGATAVSSTTGETWTLNSTGAKPAQIVKSASLMGDGAASFMSTANFSLVGPVTNYLVVRENAWASNNRLFDGTGVLQMSLLQGTSTPQLSMYSAAAGNGPVDNGNLALGAKGIVTALFNGTSNILQINNTTATTGGDVGSIAPGGLVLFSRFDGAAQWTAMQVYEWIVFSAAHDAATRALVRNYNSIWRGISLS